MISPVSTKLARTITLFSFSNCKQRRITIRNFTPFHPDSAIPAQSAHLLRICHCTSMYDNRSNTIPQDPAKVSRNRRPMKSLAPKPSLLFSTQQPNHRKSRTSRLLPICSPTRSVGHMAVHIGPGARIPGMVTLVTKTGEVSEVGAENEF